MKWKKGWSFSVSIYSERKGLIAERKMVIGERIPQAAERKMMIAERIILPIINYYKENIL
ncbi:hypothetical protein [Tenuibacillus multivorans]|nr:hypothetical protein [Tenuibacillus multivorans]GEL76951.1 hypothetical protein TMU01_11860 [Tenuibacillus multivorans]